MRNTRKLTLFAISAMATFALAAPGAMAEGGQVLVNDLTESQPCSDVSIENYPAVEGGCEIRLVAPQFAYGFAGSVVIACDTAYDVNLDASGHGIISNVDLSGPGWCDSLTYDTLSEPLEFQIHGDGEGTFHAHHDIDFNSLLTTFEGTYVTEIDNTLTELVADHSMVEPSPYHWVDGTYGRHWADATQLEIVDAE
jgi:hypothetical protein